MLWNLPSLYYKLDVFNLSECIETIVYNILFIILGHIALSLTKSFFFYIIAFVGIILILTSIDFL